MPDLLAKTGYYLSALPGAEQEAIAVAKILNVSPLTGAAATKTQVVERMKTARIIHLATHGLLDYGVKEISFERNILGAIALATDKNNNGSENGLLTAKEIITMSLQAELAVLSACHTGRGDITVDGVIGFSRAFMMAGVSSILVSLWAIPDSSTSILMENFYQEIKTGSDKAQALRQAMLKAIALEHNPIDWAAFTLIGL